jgi:hypothetical protein
MGNEFGKRRAEIMSFLDGLSEREKLIVLAYLSNDAAIGARVPSLPAAILDMHRHYHKRELLKLAEMQRPTLDLGFLARRKGCRLERAAGLPARWHIRRLHESVLRHQQRSGLTLTQALEVLRGLPDESNSASR